MTFGATSNIPEHIPARWREKLEAADDIYLALDNDKAGTAAAQRLIAALTEIGKRPILYPIPAGKDLTEFVQDQHGDLADWWTQRHEAASTCAAQTSAYLFPGGIIPTEIQKAINHFTGKQPGAALVYYLVQRGMQIGTIPTSGRYSRTQLIETAAQLGMHIPESTLYRNFGEEVPFLHARKSQELRVQF